MQKCSRVRFLKLRYDHATLLFTNLQGSSSQSKTENQLGRQSHLYILGSEDFISRHIIQSRFCVLFSMPPLRIHLPFWSRWTFLSFKIQASYFYLSHSPFLSQHNSNLSQTVYLLSLSQYLSLIISLIYSHTYFPPKIVSSKLLEDRAWESEQQQQKNQSNQLMMVSLLGQRENHKYKQIQADWRFSFYCTHIAISQGEIILRLYKKAIKCVIYLKRFLSKRLRFF